MATDQDLSNRLAFIGMDADTRAALREVQPLAVKELPGILGHPDIARPARQDWLANTVISTSTTPEYH